MGSLDSPNTGPGDRHTPAWIAPLADLIQQVAPSYAGGGQLEVQSTVFDRYVYRGEIDTVTIVRDRRQEPAVWVSFRWHAKMKGRASAPDGWVRHDNKFYALSLALCERFEFRSDGQIRLFSSYGEIVLFFPQTAGRKLDPSMVEGLDASGRPV